jgi:hypothetical protein
MNLRRLALLPALLLAAPLAPGQEPPKKDPPVIQVPPAAPGAGDPHREMQKLIGEVELRLRQIDKLLADAGSAQRPSSAASPRTAELVKRSQDQGKQVVEAIDKILELADHPHQPGGS